MEHGRDVPHNGCHDTVVDGGCRGDGCDGGLGSWGRQGGRLSRRNGGGIRCNGVVDSLRRRGERVRPRCSGWGGASRNICGCCSVDGLSNQPVRE